MSTSVNFWLPLIFVRAIFVSRIGFWIDGAILIYSVSNFNDQTVIPIEIYWQRLPVYMMVAALIFVISVWITSEARIRYLRSIFSAIAILNRSNHRREMWQALTTAVYEEVIWRVLFQSVLSTSIGPLASAVVVAASFTFWHRHGIQRNFLQTVEFFCFSITLSGLFVASHDPSLIIVVHGMRNYFIGIYGYKSKKY